jgi:hypothetical protein
MAPNSANGNGVLVRCLARPRESYRGGMDRSDGSGPVRRSEFIGQLATSTAAVGLAVGVVAWMAATRQDSAATATTQPKVPVPVAAPQIGSTAATSPASLILVVRDEAQAAEVRSWLANEDRVRAMADETPRVEWVVTAPDRDLYQALSDDANLVPTGASEPAFRLVDLR